MNKVKLQADASQAIMNNPSAFNITPAAAYAFAWSALSALEPAIRNAALDEAAKVADSAPTQTSGDRRRADAIAAAIRARKAPTTVIAEKREG